MLVQCYQTNISHYLAFNWRATKTRKIHGASAVPTLHGLTRPVPSRLWRLEAALTLLGHRDGGNEEKGGACRSVQLDGPR